MKLQGVFMMRACQCRYRRRFVQRGYNQSALLSRVISSYCRINSESWLRTRNTPAQQGLKAAQRRPNLRGALSWSEEKQQNMLPRSGQHILVSMM